MRRQFLVPLLVLPIAAVAQQRPAATAAPAQVPAISTGDRYERAMRAWDVGAYDAALADLRRVLTSREAADYEDRIAELTGETWQTVEVAKDARAPRWSPDGRHLAYELGAGAQQRIVVVRATAGFPVALEATGTSLSFSADGRTAAWLQSGARGWSIAWKRLDGGAVEESPLDVSAATALTLIGTAPLRVAVITASTGDTTSTLRLRDLAGGDGTWRSVDVEGGQPVGIERSPDGRRVVVLVGPRSAFARQMPGFAGASRVSGFAELVDGALTERIAGQQPTFSRDGSTLAWSEGEGDARVIRVRHGSAAPVTALRLGQPSQAFALSPDGATLALPMMVREDWEVFTAPTTDGAAATRLTREIQHDLFPQFVSPTRLLAVMGEGRHRRSYLYDVASGTRTRLFHNNSVRTVAPEYEWAVSPDGSKVAIVSERDGDTVTPHRHLYLMDLSAKVPREALLARVDSNLAAERALRAAGTRMFAPIAASVRAAVDEVSIGRIYGYQKDLFGFDSKHITQPGNWKATNYLLEKYRSFGLEARLQPFKTVAGREIDVANVVATIPGTVNPELVYVVGAHFDTRAEGPGADDNTSGTAMILEAARVLARRPLPATVMFVAFTGEESGLRGAREFGRRMKDSIHVVGALNNDMMGWANDFRLDNTIRYSNAGLRDVQHAAAINFSRLITYDAYYYKSTDAHALYDAWGDIVAGIGSYPILGNPHYHQPHDVLETINHQLLTEVSRTTVATIMLMASSPSRLTKLEATGTVATWAPAVEKGVTRYLVRWGPAEDPMRHSATVTAPRATLAGARPGWKVAVKAVNARGLEGWDWARSDVR
jgi:hypothetical protein